MHCFILEHDPGKYVTVLRKDRAWSPDATMINARPVAPCRALPDTPCCDVAVLTRGTRRPTLSVDHGAAVGRHCASTPRVWSTRSIKGERRRSSAGAVTYRGLALLPGMAVVHHSSTTVDICRNFVYLLLHKTKGCERANRRRDNINEEQAAAPRNIRASSGGDRHLAPSEIKMKLSRSNRACNNPAIDMRLACIAHLNHETPRSRP